MSDALTLVTALVVLSTSVVGYLTVRNGRKVEAVKSIIEEATAKVDEVHVLVNSRMSEAIARIVQLTAALVAAGVEIPPEP